MAAGKLLLRYPFSLRLQVLSSAPKGATDVAPHSPPRQSLGCNWGSGGKAPRLDSENTFMIKPA